MDHVGRIEELGNGIIDVLPGLVKRISAVPLNRIVGEREVQVFASVWSVVADIVVSSFPVLLREDLKERE